VCNLTARIHRWVYFAYFVKLYALAYFRSAIVFRVRVDFSSKSKKIITNTEEKTFRSLLSCYYATLIVCINYKRRAIARKPRDAAKFHKVVMSCWSEFREKLQYVNSFKYLRHIISSNNIDGSDIQQEITNMFIRTNILTRKFNKCTTLAYSTLHYRKRRKEEMYCGCENCAVQVVLCWTVGLWCCTLV